MPTLAQLLAATDALAPIRRARSRRARIAAARALVPADSALALGVYRARADEYVAKVAKALERYKDDVNGLADALARISMRGAARRAGKLAQSHARRELARALGLPIKPAKEGDMAVLDAFVAEQERLFSKLAGEVAAKAVRSPEAALALARQRAQLIASDQVWKVSSEATAYYALRADSEEYIWMTSGDEKVRSGHARLHMTVQRWRQPPNTGRAEGENHPGQAIHCRCKAAPLPRR
jgi:SPP1 gp7 family putative phage head morphogenesis protein